MIWWGKLRVGDQLEGLDVDGKIILKWILNKSFARAGSGLIWLWVGTGGVLL